MLTDFKSNLAQLEQIRVRMEALRGSGQLQARELNLIYESLFLRAVTIYEEFCEEFFFRLLAGSVRYAKAEKIAPTVPSCNSIRDIVFRGDKYLDWLSPALFEKTSYVTRQVVPASA